MKYPITPMLREGSLLRILVAAAIIYLSSLVVPAKQIDVPGPVGSGAFGSQVYVLPNGNFVVTDPSFDLTEPTPANDVGAVYLYDGVTLALITRLTGSMPNDRVGTGGI